MDAVTQWLWEEFQWPPWASGCCIALCLCLLMLHAVGKLKQHSSVSATRRSVGHESAEFRSFQRQYLVVYFLVMFADWLQGTHMYSLYESYGLNISALFLTGFLSSALLGNVVGPIVDKYGRRNACLVFCVLEIVINALENVPSMAVLLLGRVLGGVSTSLLFSAFESWMVTEHRARGFSEEWIAKTFAIASEGNGLLAVFAGIVAQLTADAVGEIGPFRLAIVVTAVAMAFIFSWKENFGSHSESPATASDKKVRTDTSTPPWSLSVFAVGLCYSLFEGAMYVFVFLWYPALYAVVPGSLLPSGLVFSSFMVCIAIGGKLYDMLSNKISEEKLAIVLCCLSAGVFLVPVISSQYEFILTGFLIFEMCVGAFSPCTGTLRSRYFPSERLSTTLSTFRLPTNVIVVLGTGGSNYFNRDQLFLFCSAMMVIAGACGVVLVTTTPLMEAGEKCVAAKPKRA